MGKLNNLSLYLAAIFISGLLSCERHEEINAPMVATSVFEASLPEGFQLEVFAEGLDLPTSLAFAPDGR